MRQQIYILLLLLITSGLMQAQEDTVMLRAVSIEQSRISKLEGIQKQTLDSLTLKMVKPQSLSDVLANHSPVFIKSYGQGATSTSSFRGAGASHTQVLWNGVKINSPTLGQMDFSLMPMNFVDDLTLLNGGNSLYSTGGGFGGSIMLNNAPNRKDSSLLTINEKINSLKGFHTAAEYNLVKGKWLLNTRLIHINSENEYDYKNNAIGTPPYPVETQKHAGYRQSGFMENVQFKPDNHNTFTARIWGQQNFRKLPRPLTVKEMNFSEEQDNDFMRSMLSWENKKKKRRWYVRTAWLKENYNYRNEISSLNLDNQSRLWSNHMALKYYFSSSLQLETGLNADFYKVESSSYERKRERRHIAHFLHLKYRPWKKLTALLMMRTESVNNFGIKMLPSVSLEYSPIDIHRLTISANVSRNYHMPTMNDLYWEPGGNPDLKAEDGYSYESGLTYKKQMKNINLNASVTGYYSHISNWILWQPDSLASYWTPSNLKQVRSRGIESSAGISGKWQQFIFRLNTGYTLTDAENRKKLYDGDKSVGKQLIYVPKHSANAMLYLQYKNWHLSGQYKYTGKRYTSTDNSRYMPDFMLYDAEFGRKFKLGSCLLNAAIKVNNLLDTDYQSVAWYPMPGRIYNLKINFRWNQK